MRVSVVVTPGAGRERVDRIDATHFRVAVTAPAREGRGGRGANSKQIMILKSTRGGAHGDAVGVLVSVHTNRATRP